MDGYSIRIEVPEGEVKETLKELQQAQETIYKCYSKLQSLGVLSLKKEEADRTSALGDERRVARTNDNPPAR